MERIEDCICYLAGKAAQQVTRRAREKLAPFGVSALQYAILKVLWDEDGQSGSALGERLVLDSASITGVLDRLESAELVERRSDPRDRRVHRIFLTEKGRALRRPLDAAMDEVNAEAAQAIGREAPETWSALRRLSDRKRWD